MVSVGWCSLVAATTLMAMVYDDNVVVVEVHKVHGNSVKVSPLYSNPDKRSESILSLGSPRPAPYTVPHHHFRRFDENCKFTNLTLITNNESRTA